MLGHTLVILAETLTNMNQKINTMKHITKYSYEEGRTFNGYRVNIQRKGFTFCKYFSALKGWDEAEAEAIKYEKYLMERLSSCVDKGDVMNFYLEWSENDTVTD